MTFRQSSTKPKPGKRNAIATLVRSPMFLQRIVKSKVKYTIKEKHKS